MESIIDATSIEDKTVSQFCNCKIGFMGSICERFRG